MQTTTRYYLRTRQKGANLGPSPWSPASYIDIVTTTALPSAELQKITPADTAYNSFFGWSTAVSADGKTCVIGSYLDNSPIIDAGAAYVFVRSGSIWVQQAKLIASDAATNDALGRSVDISDDGNTILVGAYQDDDKGSNSGSAYVFVRVGVKWTQQTKLTAYDGARDDFYGYSIALSGDGNTAFVGAPQDDDLANACGSGYAYYRTGTTWSLQAKFVPSELVAADMFGISADMTPDGNLLLVGAYRGSYTYLNQGAVYFFKRTAGVWKKTAVLKAADPTYNANFGQCVKLTDDGLLAFVGAYRDKSGKGAVYVYACVAGVWGFKQKLVGLDSVAGDNFGVSIAATSLGDTVLVGALFDASPLTAAGSAYLFKRESGVWAQAAKLTAHDPSANDNFGRAVGISGNGSVSIITATGLSTVTASAYAFN